MAPGPLHSIQFRRQDDGSLISTFPVRGGRLISADSGTDGCICTIDGDCIRMRVPPEHAARCTRVSYVNAVARDGTRARLQRPPDLPMGTWLMQCSRDFHTVSQPYTVHRVPSFTLSYTVEHSLPSECCGL